jgi:hypothetical protein
MQRQAGARHFRRSLTTRVLTGALAVVVFAGWLHGSWGGTRVTLVVDDLGLMVFAAVAATACVRAALHHRGRGVREHASWLALAAGMAAWAVGEGVWSYYEVYLGMGQAPFPSVADVGFLLLPVGAGLSLLVLPNRLGCQSRVRLTFDGILVAGALFVVSWLTVLGPVFAAGADTPFAFAVSVAYPLTDVIILSMVVVIGTHARAQDQATLGLVGAGMTMMAISDSAFVYLSQTGSYQSGNVIDVGWALGFTVLALAASTSRHAVTRSPWAATLRVPRRRDGVPGRFRLWFPYLPVVVAAVMGLPMALPHLRNPAAIGAVILILVLLARQLVTLSDNQRLLQRLDHLAHHDPLTGLANRTRFHHRLDQALEDTAGGTVTLVCIDLDHFKQVNDTLGHHGGDQLLNQAAQRLSACFRGTDVVARLGGDEFAVLITTPAGLADTPSGARSSHRSGSARPPGTYGPASASPPASSTPTDPAREVMTSSTTPTKRCTWTRPGPNTRYHLRPSVNQHAEADRPRERPGTASWGPRRHSGRRCRSQSRLTGARSVPRSFATPGQSQPAKRYRSSIVTALRFWGWRADMPSSVQRRPLG